MTVTWLLKSPIALSARDDAIEVWKGVFENQEARWSAYETLRMKEVFFCFHRTSMDMRLGRQQKIQAVSHYVGF